MQKLAKIVERRPIQNRKRKTKTHASDSESRPKDNGNESNNHNDEKSIFRNLKADQIEYYVHFINYDR